MRPIEKKKPGDIVRYTDSNDQEVEHTIQVDYPNYGDAKFPLASNIGQYCSYCEGYEKIHSLEVEHMAAKAKGGSRTAWNNFLLCCKICNTVKDKGQWSIWFTVFKGIDSVRARLISDFPGTCASCFDANNHYEPIERNPGSPDPI